MGQVQYGSRRSGSQRPRTCGCCCGGGLWQRSQAGRLCPESRRRASVCIERALDGNDNPAVAFSRFHSRASGRRLAEDYELLRAGEGASGAGGGSSGSSTAAAGAETGRWVLGRGKDGQVVLVRGRANRKKYALKSLARRGVALQVLQRQVAEVEIMLVLDHPNIVHVRDAYECDDTLDLVMDWCSGGELFHRLASAGAFKESEAAMAMGQMLRAVGYLHARGIAHRDLKPENWLYESRRAGAQLVLIDFGLGERVDPDVLMRQCCGSLCYVAPEVLSDGGYTHQCDMWSLGVIAFMLLLGQQPFHGSDMEIRQQILSGYVEWPEVDAAGISKDALDFLKRLLVKSPSERMNAQEAIFHPWLIRHRATGIATLSLGAPSVRSMQRYARVSATQRAVLQLAVHEIRPSEKWELAQIFLAMDTENKGGVRLRDLKEAIRRSCREDALLNDPEEHIEGSAVRDLAIKVSEFVGLCTIVDSLLCRGPAGASEPRLSFTEFMAATRGVGITLPPPCADSVFRRLDANRSGNLEVADILEALGGTVGENAAHDWMRFVCPDGNGSLVGKADFFRMLGSGVRGRSYGNDTPTSEANETSEPHS